MIVRDRDVNAGEIWRRGKTSRPPNKDSLVSINLNGFAARAGRGLQPADLIPETIFDRDVEARALELPHPGIDALARVEFYSRWHRHCEHLPGGDLGPFGHGRRPITLFAGYTGRRSNCQCGHQE